MARACKASCRTHATRSRTSWPTWAPPSKVCYVCYFVGCVLIGVDRMRDNQVHVMQLGGAVWVLYMGMGATHQYGSYAPLFFLSLSYSLSRPREDQATSHTVLKYSVRELYA